MKEFTAFEALLQPVTEELLCNAVSNYDPDYYSKSFKTKDHLIAMLYTQLHDVKSLRDLEIAFNRQSELHRMLDCRAIKRSTLGDASARRPAGCFKSMDGAKIFVVFEVIYCLRYFLLINLYNSMS